MSVVTVEEFTRVMREADQAFETSGGSTRHYVRECLFPLLERDGMIIVRKATLVAMVAALKGTIPTLTDEVERTRQSVADWPEDTNGPPTLEHDKETLAAVQMAIESMEGKL